MTEQGAFDFIMKDLFSLRIVEGAPWAFIAVMGVTGSGKSTFIPWASENSEIAIGHDLESCKCITSHRTVGAGANSSV
jgi:ABC-type lipoprotein export system ATPase subunit